MDDQEGTKSRDLSKVLNNLKIIFDDDVQKKELLRQHNAGIAFQMTGNTEGGLKQELLGRELTRRELERHRLAGKLGVGIKTILKREEILNLTLKRIPTRSHRRCLG